MAEKEKNNDSSGFIDDANSLKKIKKRPLWRTIIVRTFQVLGLFILFIIAYCILITFAKPHITVDYVEKINELSRSSTDESLNAAHDYRKAFEAYKPDPNFQILISNKQNIKDFNEAELTAVRKWIADNNTAIDYYLKAAQKPYCWWNRKLENPNETIFGLPMPEASQSRQISRLISISAQLDARGGDIKTAFNKVGSLFKSGLHFKGHRTMIEQLVGMSIQALGNQTAVNILSNKKIDPEQLKDLQIILENITAKDYPHMCFDVERFCLYDSIQKWYTDERLFGGRLIPSNELSFLVGENNMKSLISLYRLSLISASRTELIKVVNSYNDRYDELVKLTPYQGREKIDELQKELWSLMFTGISGVRYWLIPCLFAPSRGAIVIGYGNKISNEATICIIALHRYKLDKGVYPDTLEQLQQAGYIKSVPMDPWSDKSLVYKKTGDDFILYSVGENFIDDGGQVFTDWQGKKQSWSQQGGDAIFWPIQ